MLVLHIYFRKQFEFLKYIFMIYQSVKCMNHEEHVTIYIYGVYIK